jgi:hypothetical protein
MSVADLQKLCLYFVIAYVIAQISMLLYERRTNLGSAIRIYRACPLTYLRAFGMAVLTVALAMAAYEHAPAVLRWGWFSLLGTGGGSAVTQPLVRTGSHLGIGSAIATTLVYLAFVLAMPFIAQREEQIFRAGRDRWPDICLRSVLFGLSHLIVGIPIIVALVLSVPGFLLAARYRYVFFRSIESGMSRDAAIDAGVRSSTQDHSLYNVFLITFVFLGLLFAILSELLFTHT